MKSADKTQRKEDQGQGVEEPASRRDKAGGWLHPARLAAIRNVCLTFRCPSTLVAPCASLLNVADVGQQREHEKESTQNVFAFHRPTLQLDPDG